MVKFGKNKFKALKKQSKKLNKKNTNNVNNKVLKKKLNVEKKVTFQKEELLKETAESDTLVQNISKTDLVLKNLFRKPDKAQNPTESEVKKSKLKPVEKKKKRQKTQINDTKLLLKLMNKKP